MNRYIYIPFLVCFVLFSCREDFSFSIGDSKEELNFISEINPESAITANIFKTILLAGDNSDINLADVQIDFSGTDLPAKSTKFIYESQTDNFALRNFDFRPSPGNSYWIEAWVPGTDLDTIRARTFLPEPVSLKTGKVISTDLIDLGGGKIEYHLSVLFTLEEPIVRPGYFQIIPQRKVSTYRTDANGNKIITNTSMVAPLLITDIRTAANAVFEFTHKEGIFIDNSRLGDQEVVIDLVTDSPLDEATEIIKILEFRINTLSEEIYNYHRALSRQLINNQTEFVTAVNGYTNIENGFGVFGSFSTSSSSIEF